MELATLKRDTAAIDGGQWVGDIPGMGPVRLKVRGLGSKLYQVALSRRARAVPKSERERDGSLPADITMRIMGEAAHEAVLLDWDGFTENGEPVPYDKDRALTMLTEPEWRPFLDAVVWAAQIVDNGRAELEEELEKN